GGHTRRLLPFPIFLPTHIPPGLKPQTPYIDSGGIDYLVAIHYHDSHGQVALAVADGATFCCIHEDPRKYGIPVKLRSGITAHLLDFGVSIGSLDLWWEQSGSFVTVSGPRLSKVELVRIARSMSPTAVPKGS
ncbi:MAG: hypothetical protein ACR2GA_03490, partial [Chloroflexota bacterium]